MYKSVLPTIAVALLATMSGANAASTSGTIKSIDSAKDMIVLDNGSSYAVPSSANVKLSDFKVGEKVDVTFTQSGSTMEVSALKPAT